MSGIARIVALRDKMTIDLRAARLEDVPVLEGLIARAVMVLQASDYSVEQREGALGTVFEVDRQLIRDQTYLVAEQRSAIVGCGGWSRRKTLFGGDAIAGKDDGELDPGRDAVRIRAFFVDPDWSRRGIGGRILTACEAAARGLGFTRFELVATLTGEPLYRAFGYDAVERFETELPNGARLPVVRMTKTAG
jgi:GNAT superfamily N-acetyltransferase